MNAKSLKIRSLNVSGSLPAVCVPCSFVGYECVSVQYENQNKTYCYIADTVKVIEYVFGVNKEWHKQLAEEFDVGTLTIYLTILYKVKLCIERLTLQIINTILVDFTIIFDNL